MAPIVATMMDQMKLPWLKPSMLYITNPPTTAPTGSGRSRTPRPRPPKSALPGRDSRSPRSSVRRHPESHAVQRGARGNRNQHTCECEHYRAPKSALLRVQPEEIGGAQKDSPNRSDEAPCGVREYNFQDFAWLLPRSRTSSATAWATTPLLPQRKLLR